MGVWGDPLSEFTAYLSARGLGITRPRREIARIVLDREGHFTVRDLLVDLRAKGLRVGRVTVYRTLSLLVESGLVAEREFVREEKHYEVTEGKSHHEHMICLRCGRMIEFLNEEIERLQDQVAAEHDFELVHHIHKLYGYCSACRTTKANGEGAGSPKG